MSRRYFLNDKEVDLESLRSAPERYGIDPSSTRAAIAFIEAGRTRCWIGSAELRSEGRSRSMSFSVHFSFSWKTLVVPAGTKATALAHVQEVERILGL